MRHLILAALSALVALPITIPSPQPAPELYGLGITAAFGAGIFYSRSKTSERRTNEVLEQFRRQFNKVGGSIASLATDLGLLRTAVEGWRGRSDATAESHDRRLTTLESLRWEPAA
jgi:hypothetical protein